MLIMFIGYNVHRSQSLMNKLSDLALANVEALAEGDVINGNGTCYTEKNTTKVTRVPSGGGEPVLISVCEEHVCYPGTNGRSCSEGNSCKYYDGSGQSFDEIISKSCI